MQVVSRHDPELMQVIEELVAQAVARFVAEHEQKARELSLMERVIRVEEELRALREIQTAQMEAMEKRFETMERANQLRFESIEKRFEAIDKRIETLQREMDKRFEALQRRKTFLQWFMGVGFTLMSTLIGLATYLLAR